MRAASDMDRARLVLGALMPPELAVLVTSRGDGLVVTVCDTESCCINHHVPLPVVDRDLLAITESWRSGRYLPPDDALARRRMDVPRVVKIDDEMISWARTARPGDRAEYFRGNLAEYRHHGQAEIAALHSKIDRGRGSSQDTGRLIVLQEQLALLAAVDRLHSAEVIRLVQGRTGEGMIYYAVKR